MRVVYHPLVAEDLLEAATYYEHRQYRLGVAFLDEVEVGIQRIKSNPMAWGVVLDKIRRFRLSRFDAYSIRFSFDKESKTIRILSVVHGSRHPKIHLSRNDSIRDTIF